MDNVGILDAVAGVRQRLAMRGGEATFAAPASATVEVDPDGRVLFAPGEGM